MLVVVRTQHVLTHITMTWTKLELAASIMGAGRRARTSCNSLAMYVVLCLPLLLLLPLPLRLSLLPVAWDVVDSDEGFIVESNAAPESVASLTSYTARPRCVC